MRPLLILSAAVVMIGAGAAAEPAVRPIAVLVTEKGRWSDECSVLPGFAAYRARLVAAVGQRDVAALMPLLADDIVSSFGGDRGPADFRRHWALDKPAASPLWRELEAVLALGCGAWDTTSLVMPGYTVRIPEDTDSSAAVVALRRTAVRLRASETATAIATLPMGALVAWELRPDAQSPWTRVIVDGRSGWARTSDVRPLLDYRASFERVDGAWKMSAFVAGD